MKVFKEEQRFTQIWIIVLIIISGLVPVLIILSNYLEDNSSISTVNLFSTIGITVLVSGLIFLFKLKTRIDEKGIHYKFFPFHFKLKTISWSDIEKAYVRKYDAITEYGGWGLKGGFFWNKSKGTAVNVSGDIGIQLELTNGKKLLIGTKLEEEAKQVIKNYNSKIKF
jgi:hypothetical protein